MSKLTYANRCELMILLRDLLLARGYKLHASRQSAYNWSTHRLAPAPERLFAALMLLALVAPDADALLISGLRSIGIDLSLPDLIAALSDDIAIPLDQGDSL